MQQQTITQATLAEALVPRTGVLRDVSVILGFSLFIALCARITIPLPFTPVPITGQTLGVLLAGGALGARRGGLSAVCYVGLGVAGLPVFATAGGQATWGYLAGFILAATVVGLLAERGWDRTFGRSVLAMAIGNAVIYVPGLIWLARFVGPESVLALGLLPFVAGDAIKLLIAAGVLPSVWALQRRRGQ